MGPDREYGRFHLQLYSMMRSAGRMKFLAGSESGQGAWISDTTPETIADRFREVAKPRWSRTRSDQEGAADAAALFHEVYSATPELVCAAPGRVNLIGEHVDYAAGMCLPFALSQNTYAALARRQDSLVRIVSDLGESGEPFTMELSHIGPGVPNNWARVRTRHYLGHGGLGDYCPNRRWVSTLPLAPMCPWVGDFLAPPPWSAPWVWPPLN